MPTSTQYLIILHGPPASGKTELARRLGQQWPNLEVMGTDEIRQTRQIAPDDTWSLLCVYRSLGEWAQSRLRRGASVLLDATFYRRDLRGAVLSQLAGILCIRAFVTVSTPVTVCRDRVLARALNGTSPYEGVNRLGRFDDVVASSQPIDSTELHGCWSRAVVDCSSTPPVLEKVWGSDAGHLLRLLAGACDVSRVSTKREVIRGDTRTEGDHR
jgi:predicted kinase